MNITKNSVFNWHITEGCNFHCKHCFAKWNHVNEIWTNADDVRKVLSNIANFNGMDAPIPRNRLNIVGGEPILQQEHLWRVIKMAYKMGFEISIITNGSHLENIRPFVHLISQVGISIDSFDHNTNIKIGRECNGETISFQQLDSQLKELRTLNPELKIKINTVINNFNFNEILVDSIARLNINKWKLLRQMPFNGKGGITDFKFYTFLFNNLKEEKMPKKQAAEYFFCFDQPERRSNNIIFVEDNDVMTESYLMIAPDGRLFQNGGAEYKYSRPLTKVSLEEALSEISFNPEKFEQRYGCDATEKAKQDMERYFLMNQKGN